MASKIASLYAEISADTTKLQKGLSDSKSKLTQFKGGLNEVVQGVTGFNLSQIGMVGALVTVGNTIKGAINDYTAYGESIRGMAAITGTGTEETSRLVQAFDDLGISQGQVEAAMVSAARKGFVFSIENVKKLGNEYNTLSTQEEKNALLNEKLGRGGLELAKAFDEGGDAIARMANEQAAGMVITEKQIAQLERLRRQTDNLEDSWTGIKNTFAQQVVPGLLDTTNAVTKVTERTSFWDRILAGNAITLGIVTLAEAQHQKTLREAAEAAIGATEGIAGYSGVLENVPGQVEAAAEEQNELNILMRDYNETLLFTMATEDLDAEAKMRLAESMGLIDEKTRFARVKTQEWKEELQKGKISVEEYERRVGGLADQLARITSKTVTITTRFVEQHYINRIGEEGPGQVVGTATPGKKAVGGPKPDVSWVGEQGPELQVGGRGTYILSNKDAMKAVMGGGEGGIVVNMYLTGYGQTPNPQVLGATVAREIQRRM